jgi:rubrerythrin
MVDKLLISIRYAIEAEIRGLKFYKFCLDKIPNPGSKELFKMLIQEEKKHRDDLAKMLKQSAKSDAEVKEVEAEFKKLEVGLPVFDKEHLRSFTKDGVQVPEMFNKARDMEEEASRFYAGLASRAKDKKAKDFFTKLSKQEKDHRERIVSLGLTLL